MKNNFISHCWKIFESFSLQDATFILNIFTLSLPLLCSNSGLKLAFILIIWSTAILLGIPSTTSSVQPASYVGNDWVLTKTSVRNVSAKQAFNVVGNIFLRTVIYQVMSVFFLSFMALRLENKNWRENQIFRFVLGSLELLLKWKFSCVLYF